MECKSQIQDTVDGLIQIMCFIISTPVTKVDAGGKARSSPQHRVFIDFPPNTLRRTRGKHSVTELLLGTTVSRGAYTNREVRKSHWEAGLE